ncbi:MAG: DUF2294 domain-containing protein [Leptolyngbyaceae cyanobacterium bins.59]|nr:DUF2294 domain-containing protein [Leptolyngbyaceae cyanobacterium bins.59]
MTLLPTRGELERALCQRIQTLYREQLGHQPGKISCCISEQQIAIVIENAMTPPEQILVSQGKEALVEAVRSGLDQAIRPQLQQLIQDIVHLEVTDVLSDATLETGRTGTIAILSGAVQLRESSSRRKQVSVS